MFTTLTLLYYSSCASQVISAQLSEDGMTAQILFPSSWEDFSLHHSKVWAGIAK